MTHTTGGAGQTRAASHSESADMLRSLHKFPGLIAAVLIVVLTLTGAALSVMPAWERLQAPAQVEGNLSVATLAARVLAEFPSVEQLHRAPSGAITAFYYDNDQPATVVIDPATGKALSVETQSTVLRWLTNLHRSLLLDDIGRLAAAAAAAAMLALSLSGVFLVARRVGGWRRFFTRLRGPVAGRLHVELARLAVPGLLLSALTALFMVATTFSLIPEPAALTGIPDTVSGQMGISPADIPTLQTTAVADLRELTFPYPNDETDAYTLTSRAGEAYLDQGTGAVLDALAPSLLQQVTETVYMLHTGQGSWAWALGLLLGASALAAPMMAYTGAAMWWRARQARPRLVGNQPAARADTILLVGSEGGTTWGFAATLHAALTAAGHRVHAAPLARFAPETYGQAAQVIILAATYGNGDAPDSARGFLGRMAAMPIAPKARLAVLGFGDRQFPAFCAYATAITDAATAKGWQSLLPMDTVDRQSPQDFARWGHALGQALDHDLTLAHQPVLPRSQALTLISRRDYGADMQTPTAILRFALPVTGWLDRLRGRGLARFAAGDLLGIVPTGSTVPRLYSLASATTDGFVEICVRKHPGGLCSAQLLDLQPGDTMQAFIRANPDFRPARGTAPVILIGAGTGIGPLAGFARANRPGRAMHLYYGARHPNSDLLFGEELQQWQAEQRLTSVNTAFSRTATRAYVQDALRKDATRIAKLIEGGAQVLVCGGRDMAAGVAAALTEVLAPQDLTPAMMKAEGRYAEDVY